jgi:hypothetical protein
MLDVPACAETPVGSLWCVGLIRNTLSVAVSAVVVRVSLVTADGTALAQQDVLSARPFVRAGEWSPYGALFTAPPSGFAGPVAELISDEATPQTGAISLTVTNRHETPGSTGDPNYHVQATIDNRSSTAVRAIVIAALFDSEGHVGGFREIEPDATLASGATLTIDTGITPLFSGVMRSDIVADGLPITN